LIGVFAEQVSEVGVVAERVVGLELVPDGVAAQFPRVLDIARLLILDRAGREEVFALGDADPDDFGGALAFEVSEFGLDVARCGWKLIDDG
jgi:hypothetical protein